MNVRIFICTVLLALISVTGYGQSYKDWTHKVEKNELGKCAQVTSFSGKIPTMKSIYTYDLLGNKQTKELYAWNRKKLDWQPLFKIDYYYDKNNRLSCCSQALWDKVTENWSEKSKQMVYDYTDNGELLSVKYTKTLKIHQFYTLTQR